MLQRECTCCCHYIFTQFFPPDNTVNLPQEDQFSQLDTNFLKAKDGAWVLSFS